MAICTKADLRRDNIESAGGWGLLVGPDHVSLHFPVTDDGRGRWIEIPRADFDLLAGWYVAAHTPPEEAR